MQIDQVVNDACIYFWVKLLLKLMIVVYNEIL